MKTPRAILLARHRAAEPDLDAIRARAVAAIAAEIETFDPRSPANFVEFLISLRWHAVAISALWLLIALLGTEHPHRQRSVVASGADTPPLVYLIALREYSQQLEEAASPPAPAQPPPVPQSCADPRREQESNKVV